MNNKPQWRAGTLRYEIMRIMLSGSVLSLRGRSLLNEAPQSMANVMRAMRREGVIEQCRSICTFDCIDTGNYAKNLLVLREKLPVETVDWFGRYGTHDLKRAKYGKGKTAGDAARIIQNSEIIVLMHMAKVATLPDEKGKSAKISEGTRVATAIYYQTRELKTLAKKKDPVEIAARANGLLVTGNENYAIYHTGKGIKLWSAAGEYKFKNLSERILSQWENQHDSMVNNAIVFTYNPSMFAMVMDLSKKTAARYSGLAETYKNVYLLPYSIDGRDMVTLMCRADWKEAIRAYLSDGISGKSERPGIEADYFDGETYSFFLCIPNLTRYIRFVTEARMRRGADQFKFRVFCFDFQKEFAAATIGGYARITYLKFSDYLKAQGITRKDRE